MLSDKVSPVQSSERGSEGGREEMLSSPPSRSFLSFGRWTRKCSTPVRPTFFRMRRRLKRTFDASSAYSWAVSQGHLHHVRPVPTRPAVASPATFAPLLPQPSLHSLSSSSDLPPLPPPPPPRLSGPSATTTSPALSATPGPSPSATRPTSSPTPSQTSPSSSPSSPCAAARKPWHSSSLEDGLGRGGHLSESIVVLD